MKEEQQITDARNDWENGQNYSGKHLAGIVARMKNPEKEKVIEARKIEIGYTRKMEAYAKVHHREARGHQIITARRADTNKGVDDFRSILFDRELNCDTIHDSPAPTLLLDAMKVLISLCAKPQDRVKPLRIRYE